MIKEKCNNSWSGSHEWRTKRANEETNVLEKVLPYCWNCKIIDETDTKKDTPIPGDKNYHS